MRRIVLLVPLALFLGIALFLYRGLFLDPSELPSALIGKPFPAFSLPSVIEPGKTITQADLLGKPSLVNVWATWCGPCVAEMPNVVAAYRKYHERGFEVIGVSLDKDEEAMKRFVKENKMSWPQFFDGQGWGNALAAKYGIQSIPATFLVDADGKIVAKDLRGAALEAELARRLEKK